MSNSPLHIELENVQKSFGPKVVLDGINLSVKKRPVSGRHRRFGLGKIRNAKMHHRADGSH